MDLYSMIKMACIRKGIRIQDFAYNIGITRQALYKKCNAGILQKGFNWTPEQEEKLKELLK